MAIRDQYYGSTYALPYVGSTMLVYPMYATADISDENHYDYRYTEQRYREDRCLYCNRRYFAEQVECVGCGAPL
jgi:hypothetical protein